MRKRVILPILVILVSALLISPAQAAVPPELPASYKEQLSSYRLQYDKVAVSLQQYANLKTLASQEEAVQVMRDFLLIRGDVMTTHFQILQFDLRDQQTIDPLWVASASARIDQVSQDIKDHHSRSDIAVDRIRSDAEALWFQQHEKDMKSTADRAQSLIAMGRVALAIRHLETVKQKIDDWVAASTMSETAKVEKRRGIDELGRTIEEAKATLAMATTLYSRGSTGELTNLVYPQIKPITITAYTAVQRGIEFSKELTK